MEGITIFIVCTVLWMFLVCVAAAFQSNGRRATIRVKDGDRTLASATGSSVNEAVQNLFDKLYNQVQSLTKPEAIQRRIDQMNSAMDESGGMVSKRTKEYCTNLLVRSKEKCRRLADQEKLQIDEAKRIATENRRLREKQMSAHRRMVAEQRRLMTNSLKYDILVRDGFRCRICGASAADGVKLHVDHVLPVSKGGKTAPSNLRTLCERCNLGKSDKIEQIPVPSALCSPVISEESPEINWSLEEAIAELKGRNIRCVDRTDRGGCFWIELTPESEALLRGKQIDGKAICTAKHAKVFSNNPAMYIK